jgi:hypothetical protein
MMVGTVLVRCLHLRTDPPFDLELQAYRLTATSYTTIEMALLGTLVLADSFRPS